MTDLLAASAVIDEDAERRDGPRRRLAGRRQFDKDLVHSADLLRLTYTALCVLTLYQSFDDLRLAFTLNTSRFHRAFDTLECPAVLVTVLVAAMCICALDTVLLWCHADSPAPAASGPRLELALRRTLHWVSRTGARIRLTVTGRVRHLAWAVLGMGWLYLAAVIEMHGADISVSLPLSLVDEVLGAWACGLLDALSKNRTGADHA